MLDTVANVIAFAFRIYFVILSLPLAEPIYTTNQFPRTTAEMQRTASFQLMLICLLIAGTASILSATSICVSIILVLLHWHNFTSLAFLVLTSPQVIYGSLSLIRHAINVRNEPLNDRMENRLERQADRHDFFKRILNTLWDLLITILPQLVRNRNREPVPIIEPDVYHVPSIFETRQQAIELCEVPYRRPITRYSNSSEENYALPVRRQRLSDVSSQQRQNLHQELNQRILSRNSQRNVEVIDISGNRRPQTTRSTGQPRVYHGYNSVKRCLECHLLVCECFYREDFNRK